MQIKAQEVIRIHCAPDREDKALAGAADSPFMGRFFSKVNRNGPVMPHMTDQCWPWTGATNDKGYGVFYLDGAFVKAHRLSYSLVNGPIEATLLLRHECDHPACVRPSHLLPGTNKENVEDMVKRGRHRNGHTAQVERLAKFA